MSLEVEHHDLTDDRILAMAHLISSTRAGAVDSHSPEEGDTNKSLGFTAYERTRSTINAVAGTPGYEWLRALTPDGRFTFCIGNTPVRFWKGRADRLPGEKLIRSEEALRQIDLDFSQEPVSSLIWYIIVETGPNKLVDRAFLIGFTEHGVQQVKKEIPISGQVNTIYSTDKPETNAVEIKSAADRLRRRVKGPDHDKRDASQ